MGKEQVLKVSLLPLLKGVNTVLQHEQGSEMRPKQNVKTIKKIKHKLTDRIGRQRDQLANLLPEEGDMKGWLANTQVILSNAHFPLITQYRAKLMQS